MVPEKFDLQEELKNLPERPGVYLHHNSDGEIIYIGKAKNLKNRVNQYFQTNRDRSVKIMMMVSHIAYFEYIITDTENDALLLENRLIKKYMPRYNTLLKDGMKTLWDMTVSFIPKLIVALLVLWVGWKLAKMVKRAIVKLLDKRNVEASLKSFLTSLVDVLLKVMLVFMVMDIIGIKATSFIALLGAAGLAVGMALQGTLQNFAGGVIILLMKPFKVDDYIECGGYKGYVKEIRIFHTIIQPFNGRTIIVPNSSLATTSLTNHTRQPQIRLDVVASVAYGTDLDYAKEVLREIIDNDPLILKDPPAKIAVSELGNSSVDFSLWMWVKTEDYWTVWMRIRIHTVQ